MTPANETPKGPESNTDLQKNVLEQKKNWNEFQSNYIREFKDHELVRPLLDIHTAAQRLLLENDKLLQGDLPGAYERCTQNCEELADLYKDANEIRARIIGEQNRFGPEVSSDVSKHVEGLKFPEPMQQTLTPILNAMSVDLTADFSKDSNNTFFSRDRNGLLTVNMSKLRGAEKEIDKLQALASTPEQKQFLNGVHAQLQEFEKIDPIARQMSKELKISKGWKLAAAFVLAFYTAWGLAYKNLGFASITALGLLAVVRPDLLKGKTGTDIEQSLFLTDAKNRAFLAKQLKQPGSSKAVEELYARIDGKTGDPRTIKGLLSQEKIITNAQLDQYFGTEDASALRALLYDIPSGERVRTLKLLTRARQDGARQIVLAAVKNEFELRNPDVVENDVREATQPEPS